MARALAPAPVLAAIALVSAVGITTAGCSKDTIAVSHEQIEDYNHGKLDGAVDKFVAAGKTAAAFQQLAAGIATLRPGMDHSVAAEAERKLIVLALAPMTAAEAKPIADRKAALALTVWPTLLAPAVEADALLVTRDPKTPQLAPIAGETPDAYLQRLCGGPLVADCKTVVPDQQAEVVAAVAIHRATERARDAIGDCVSCAGDPGWHEAVRTWERMDRDANVSLGDVLRRADPDNWPTAGAAAEDDPGLPEAELSTHGDLVVGDHSYGPNQQRIDVLRQLRGDGHVIALHLHPDISLAQTRAILIDAKAAGCDRVAIVAREPVYPWRRRAYWIANGQGMRANLRPTDTLQLLLHAIDEVAGPGTVARVD